MNCDQILRSIPTTKARHIFGHRDDSGVEIGLPYELENGEHFPWYWHNHFVPQILSKSTLADVFENRRSELRSNNS